MKIKMSFHIQNVNKRIIKWHRRVCVLLMTHSDQHIQIIKTSVSILYITVMILKNHGQKWLLGCCRVMQKGGDNNGREIFFFIADFDLLCTASSRKCNLVS